MSASSISFLETNVPKLSKLVSYIEEIEESDIYSNYGPVNTQFEKSLVENNFSGIGGCVTVCNATIGIMLALKYVTRHIRSSEKPYVLMPSFTFAAAGHAVMWAGFTPLFTDIDPATWASSRESEGEMLAAFSSRIAAIFPYATFGNPIDLDYYNGLSQMYDIPIVVDAASSLGAVDLSSRHFGTGFPFPVVFSLHATKSLGVGEGGFIYCADTTAIAQMRAMGNFGFEKSRHATICGINSKMPEISALLGLEGLKKLEEISEKKSEIAGLYRTYLPEFVFQQQSGKRSTYQFMPVRVPGADKERRGRLLTLMAESRIGTASYFSPHLAEQQYFSSFGGSDSLPVTAEVASSIISLPVKYSMTEGDIEYISSRLRMNMQRAFN